MGYYVRLTDSEVTLKNEHLPEILQRWKDLNKPENNHLKHGGSWDGGKQTQWWFSWMDADYDKTVNSAEEVLEMLGFEYDVTDEGNVHITNYDSKTGSEDLFMKTIADLIEPGSTMLWHGEDGATFAWYFNGEGMQEMDMKKALKLAVEQQAKGKTSVTEVKSETDQEKLNRRYKNLL